MVTSPLRVSELSAARNLPHFRLADAAPDVRGWVAISADDRTVGTIARLIVEMRTGAIRYLVVDLEPDLERRSRRVFSRSVLVPVGLARPVDDVQAVMLDVGSQQLRVAPRIPERPITRDDEERTLATFGLPPLADHTGDPYRGRHFDASRLLSPRH